MHTNPRTVQHVNQTRTTSLICVCSLKRQFTVNSVIISSLHAHESQVKWSPEITNCYYYYYYYLHLEGRDHKPEGCVFSPADWSQQTSCIDPSDALNQVWAASVVYQNAATLFYCEAPELWSITQSSSVCVCVCVLRLRSADRLELR